MGMRSSSKPDAFLLLFEPDSSTRLNVPFYPNNEIVLVFCFFSHCCLFDNSCIVIVGDFMV